MVHANRFGEFEERYAGGVRKNQSYYLRSVLDVCIFQWRAAALIGFHVTPPFMSIIIDHNVIQRQLLAIFTKFYEEIIVYPNSYVSFDKPALSSLSK